MKPKSGDGPPDEWDDGPVDGPGSEAYRVRLAEARAQRLRTAWIQAVREYHLRRHGTHSAYNSNIVWDGGRDRNTKKLHQPLWPRLVARADELGIDPVALLGVLFEALTSDEVPVPRAIVADENVERYRRRAPLRAARVASAARNEEATFRTGVWAAESHVADPRACVRHVLNDMGRQLSPLYRYCMARRTGHDDIAARWREAAENQFAADRQAYLTYWAALLPPELAEAAPV